MCLILVHDGIKVLTFEQNRRSKSGVFKVADFKCKTYLYNCLLY